MPDVTFAAVTRIAALRQQGATWAQIAPAIGCDGPKAAKAAKRVAREADKRARRELAAR